MDCCAGYPHVRNLCCWGTRIGNMGLLVRARLNCNGTAGLCTVPTLPRMFSFWYESVLRFGLQRVCMYAYHSCTNAHADK